MQQIALPLIEATVAPEIMIGLTPWTNAGKQQPPMVGWWKCRKVGYGHTIFRRWWNGTAFSAAVKLWSDDDQTLEGKQLLTTAPLDHIEWCGLLARHPGHYPYRLFMKEVHHARVTRRPFNLS